MRTTNKKHCFPCVSRTVRLSMAALAFLSCLSAIIGCDNGSTANLKPEDTKRIKGEKVTAEKLSAAQLQAARDEIGLKLSKTNGPTNVPQLNPASLGKPK